MTTPEMTEIAMWTLVVGFVMPLLISVVQQSAHQGVRAITALVSSLIAGAGTVYITNPDEFTTKPVVTVGLTIAVVAISTYNHFWRAVLGSQIDRVDEATRVL